jgi:cytochrome c5
MGRKLIALAVGTLVCTFVVRESLVSRLEARAAAAQSADQAGAAGDPAVRALFDQYCVTCHNERLKTAGLLLDQVDLGHVATHAEALEKVIRKLRSGQMPPEGRPRPDRATVVRAIGSLESSLDRASTAPSPGRVATRRLNRTEYVNAIRDLLDLEVDGTALLPSDMAGFGFDNNADVLSITPGLMDRYMTAATKVSRIAVGSPDNRPIIQTYRVPNGARQEGRMGESLPFGTHGGVAVRHTFPLDGEYVFKVRLQRGEVGESILGSIAEREYHIELRIDHALVKVLTVGGKFRGQVKYDLSGGGISPPEDDTVHRAIAYYNQTADKDLDVRLPVKAGTRLVSASFIDIAPSATDGEGDTVVAGVSTLEVDGPYQGSVPTQTASRKRIFICHPSTAADETPCARRIISTLARRAYRRPVSDADVLPLMTVYELGRRERGFDGGIERALEAMLSLPKFLLRAEAEPADARPGTVYQLGDVDLASRLSFFLWRSIPDDELIDLAAKRQLHAPGVLERQVARLLADARADRFLQDFVDQWLEIRNLQTREPDPVRFPEFDNTLREAMIRETELFFASQVRGDHDLLDLLRADYTFLNARLAEHYRIPDIYGSHFRRVTVTDSARQGLLGQASILMVSSYPDRTSVVLRGKWLLEALLGAPPPPPPPNVPPLKQNDGKSAPQSLRERMEQHRRNPVCAACHNNMDPLGFTLENFNAVGRWRDADEGAAINPSVALNGVQMDGAKGLREALLARGDEVRRTITEKMLIFALGRGLDYHDAKTVRQLRRDGAQQGNRWSALVLGIVKSSPFQTRAVPEAQPAAPAPNVIAQGGR